MKRLTSQEIEQVCLRYQAGESSVTIAVSFGVSHVAIIGLLARHGVPRRDRSASQRRYVCNHGFFSTIATEAQAYWLGVLATDGYVSLASYGAPNLVVWVSENDTECLERFRAVLESTHPVARYQYGEQSFAQFRLRSQQLASDLGQYGIIHMMTFTVPWPSLSDQFTVHLARGYADGDGGFHLTADNRTPTSMNHVFEVTGNQTLISAYQSFLTQTCQLSQTKLDQRPRETPIYTLRYSGSQQVGRIVRLLYAGATVYLPRKRDQAPLT
jgi:hypothetical protein